ncbi:excitatory amino acid transporter-like isoform X2 [Ostrea edulis]|uniref:excitatory amino acid transporter-like isoform X2 n=1 Tax=Ostrea edulis TaxID=37623 RepID=UPI0024AFC626|nr:excitatory amino acid transporter-like isoform X2 [Ostrea edulis]
MSRSEIKQTCPERGDKSPTSIDQDFCDEATGELLLTQNNGKQQAWKSNKKHSKCYEFLSRNGLIISVLAGVVVGIVFGLSLRVVEPSDDAITWIGLPGEIYMRLLKMAILPLVVSTIITGTASMDPRSNGRISALSFGYIVITNTIGAVIAIVVFLVIRPGQDIQVSDTEYSDLVQTDIQTSDMFADMIRNLFPDNIVTACFQKTQTKYTRTTQVIMVNGTNSSIPVIHKYVSSTGGLNILGLIIVCTLFGITAGKLGRRAEPFTEFFDTVSIMIIHLLNWIIWSTPVGVASLIAKALLSAKDIDNIFRSLGMFVLAHSIGIVLHQLVLIPIAYYIATRKNPLVFLSTCLRPWLTVFGPPSTAIGIPEMLKTLHEKLHVDTRISNFLVPVGATLERLGSCIFICLSAMFLVQLEGISLDASRIFFIGLLSTLGSLAVPAVPSSSIVSILVVLSSLDVQVHNIGLLMALEWYNDRIRTTSNTMTIIVGGVIIDRLCKSSLRSTAFHSSKDKCTRESEAQVKVENEKMSTKF